MEVVEWRFNCLTTPVSRCSELSQVLSTVGTRSAQCMMVLCHVVAYYSILYFEKQASVVNVSVVVVVVYCCAMISVSFLLSLFVSDI